MAGVIVGFVASRLKLLRRGGNPKGVGARDRSRWIKLTHYPALVHVDRERPRA
jgi:hypothetical protein